MKLNAKRNNNIIFKKDVRLMDLLMNNKCFMKIENKRE